MDLGRSLAISFCLAASLASAQDDLGTTLRIAEERLKQHPDDLRLLTLRAVVLSRMGNVKESVAAFDRVLKLDPKYLPALQGAAETAYSKRLPEARSRVDRVLALDPSSETAHAMAGTLSFESKDCTAAVAHFRQSTSLIAKSPVALAQFGECLLATDHAPEAAAALRSAVEHGERSPVVAYNLGLALYLTRDYAGAVTALSAVPKPDSETRNLLAASKAAAGDLTGAIAAYRQAIDRYPHDERNYMDLATLCLDHDSSELALEILDIGLRNNPDAAGLYTMRGALHAQLGSPEKAQADFEKARLLEPDQLYGSVGLSLLLRQNGRPEEAVALVRQKLKDQPADAVLNYLLADSLLRQGASPGEPAFEEAKRALQRAVAATPSFAKAHAALGKMLLKEQKPEAAVNSLETAVRYDPSDRTALNQLILALRASGKSEAAAEAARKLRATLDADRRAEVQRNRMQLVRRDTQ